MIYEFKCRCGFHGDFYFTSHKNVEQPFCPHCGWLMERVYTVPAIRPNGMQKPPKGVVEVGNEDVKPDKQPDRYAGVEKEMMDVIDSGVDLDGSGDYELQKLQS